VMGFDRASWLNTFGRTVAMGFTNNCCCCLLLLLFL
jgi:hypothetical protein